jgi:hypothetical protein
MKYLIALLLPIIVLYSCDETGSTGDEMKRPAGGDADEIMVVVDSAVWDGPVGQEIRKTLASPMIGMPQDEALFDIYKVNPLKLNSVLKSAYNMIYVTTLDSRSSQSRELHSMFTDESLKKIQSDTSFFQVTEDNKFAIGQKILYLFANSEADLADKISKNRGAILNVFETQARKITKARMLDTRSTGIEKTIRDGHGYSIQVPYGWDVGKDLPDFVWIRELDRQKEKNIFIYQERYTSMDVFNDISALRDRITELYLKDGQKSDLHIKRQEVIPVFSKRINFNNKFAMESRGLWAVSDNTAGGPFLSYTLVDEENQMLYYIEGYVYHAAGKKKRLMREMDAILSTFRMPSEIKK